MAPRSLWSANDRRAPAQVASSAESLASMACSFRARAEMSSMAGRWAGRSRERRWETRRSGEEEEGAEEEVEEEGTPSSLSPSASKGVEGSSSPPPCCCCESRAFTSPQCLARIALLDSRTSKGTRSATWSTEARQAAYAGHSLRLFGKESAAAWKPATRSAISAVASKTSTTEEEEEASPLPPLLPR
jgi:hypothetical protein